LASNSTGHFASSAIISKMPHLQFPFSLCGGMARLQANGAAHLRAASDANPAQSARSLLQPG
jgi:hypothetical protein